VLTLNLGADIPTAWLNYNYQQMLTAIDGEIRNQLSLFLQAKLQPDIILLENEGTSGMLYNVVLNGKKRTRGAKDDMVDQAQLQKELCGQVPTGSFFSYPQMAGYIKQEIITARDAIRKAGMDPSLTRFGLHSHGQYMDWKNGMVYNGRADQDTHYTGNGIDCIFMGSYPILF